MADLIDLKDFVAGFLIEAEEHLHSVNDNLVSVAEAVKKGRSEPRAVRELFRSLHTIKGLAAMVGAEPIVEIAHEMEELLRNADRAGGILGEAALDLLSKGTRVVEERVRFVGQSGIQNIPAVPTKLVEALAIANQGKFQSEKKRLYEFSLPDEIMSQLTAADREQIYQASGKQKRVVLIDFQPSPENSAAGFNITSIRERLAKHSELIKVLPRSASSAPTGIAFSLLIETQVGDEILKEQTADSSLQEILMSESTAVDARLSTDAPPSPEENTADWVPSEQSSIRVDVKRLDEALEQLSGLFVTRFKLDRVANDLALKHVDVRELKSVINETARQLRRLRGAISEARMVPLSDLLQRLPLVVRGITKDSDKSVNLNIFAGTAEVDKAVADKIFPALVHLVRNAVDHAIESRSERRASSKSEEGEISIVCDNSAGTNLIITITDDGRGIDRQAVARKSGCPIAPNDDELLRQICTPGLSTSNAVTHTSGRGMGMDIVKRTIELLGGALSLKTNPGKGSTITLKVPVTVTIVDVFSFVSGAQTFVAPVAIVDEIIEIDMKDATVLPTPENTSRTTMLIQHRGRTIPFFVLESVLDQKVDSRRSQKALVINRTHNPIAFGIEKVLGKQEAVVRPLDDSLLRIAGMAGATDLGDGRPTLVLDLAALGSAILQNGILQHRGNLQ